MFFIKIYHKNKLLLVRKKLIVHMINYLKFCDNSKYDEYKDSNYQQLDIEIVRDEEFYNRPFCKVKR